MKVLDENDMSGSTLFTKLDANAGFWQIKLTEESALYTTFITPFGRYCFKRLPFEITSAPEFFQKSMSAILTNLDDILIHGRNQEEHDKGLNAVLDKLQQAGVTLSRDKCKFSTTYVQFLGQQVDSRGIRPDPAKVSTI